MNISVIKQISYAAATAGLGLLLAGTLPAQGMNRPQGQGYPQGGGQYPGQTTNLPNGEPMPTTNVLNDKDFAKDAVEGGMMEVKLGQLAQDKGTSQAVKDFGKRMVEDHTAANDKLKTLASQQNVKVPDEISKHDQKTYDKLSQLSGAAFDRQYAKDMVRDHENDVSAFQQEAKSGQIAAIKQFATETLPTLEEHLKMAREMEREVGKNGKSGAE